MCSVCNHKFDTEQALNQHCKATNHIQGHHSNQNQKTLCIYCLKTFNSEQARNQHVHDAHKDKKFKCPDCRKKFTTQEGRVQHQKMVHSNQSAKKSPKKKSSENKRSKESVWIKCPYCNELQAEKELNKHIKKNHEFACPHCTENLKSQKSLKNHIAKNHQDKTFVSFICDTCEKAFITERDLTKHVKEVHNRPQIQHLQPKHKNREENKQQESMWSKLTTISLRKENKGKKPSMEQVMRSLNLSKRVVIMDENVGNDTTVIEALGETYDVRQLPSELKGSSDEYLRAILEINSWGLVSKDYDMVMRAREMNIDPIFLILDKQKHRVMTIISDGTYRLK
jgi:uncharacterized C2H2 Zn-finger protein